MHNTVQGVKGWFAANLVVAANKRVTARRCISRDVKAATLTKRKSYPLPL